jgi:hypothetical protein
MRQDLKINQLVETSIKAWWDSLRHLSDSDRADMKEKPRSDRRSSIAMLTESEYILEPGLSKQQFNTMMRAMHHMLEPDGNDLAEDELDRDWRTDQTHGAPPLGPAGYMGYEEFYSSVFELCDLWIDGLGT